MSEKNIASKKIVVIGGGTGTFTVLSGLKKYTSNLTAIVSMADSGGSTGRLRDEFGILPPGDVRRALIALSSEPEQLTLRRLFEYRFEKGNGLSGHSFGNLFLTALSDIVGSEVLAIEEAGRLLNISGTVLPVSLTNTNLVARLEDGTVVRGETNIDLRVIKPEMKIADVFLDPVASAYPQALDAILAADLVVIGPGDLYTSVIANLLVDGVGQAIAQSSARVLYVCNIMNKYVETNNFSVADYAREIERYLGREDANTEPVVDILLCSTDGYPKDLLLKYEGERAYPPEFNMQEVLKIVPSVIARDFATRGTLLRHDPEKLAAAIVDIF